jgi:hypothetical protein
MQMKLTAGAPILLSEIDVSRQSNFWPHNSRISERDSFIEHAGAPQFFREIVALHVAASCRDKLNTLRVILAARIPRWSAVEFDPSANHNAADAGALKGHSVAVQMMIAIVE